MDDILYKPVSGEKLIGVLRKWCVRSDNGKPDAGFVLPPEFRERLRLELQHQLGVLRTALADGDAQQLADHLHQLKGITGYFGLPEFTGALEVLRDAIHAQAQEQIAAILDDMEHMVRADN